MVQDPKTSQPTVLNCLELVLFMGKSLDAKSICCSSLSGGTLLRQILSVGAVCVSSARTDLCGGYQVTGIPTATVFATCSDLIFEIGKRGSWQCVYRFLACLSKYCKAS